MKSPSTQALPQTTLLRTGHIESALGGAHHRRGVSKFGTFGRLSHQPHFIMTAFIVLMVVLAIVVIYFISQYNRLVSLRNRFKNAFAQIDVQLKRRYDLIPNLVEVAKGYMAHERETLEAVIQARNQASQAEQRAASDPGDAEAMGNLMAAERGLTGALGRFFALSEAYPDLKANQNMARLQEELATTENRIAFARQSYNDAVMNYNTARESFPTNVVAGMAGFDAARLFEVEAEAEREAPRVSF
jgi:LemA protein